MSLRSRLLAAILLLVAAGLLASSLATYRFLSSFLLGRVDRQLAAAALPAVRVLALADALPDVGFPAPGARALFPVGTYAAVLDPQGGVLREHVFAFEREPPPPPSLPPGLLGSAGAGAREPARFTVPAEGGGHRYRVLAAPLPGGRTFVVAVPLDEVEATLARLIVIEAAVTAAVLAGLAGLAWWIIRLGFRPLERMAETAGAIAAGDLSRRVEPAEPRTEVGRLGLALNAMLARLEGAFAERRASEERLRRFVADASHELRTPLTSIRGYSELFRRGAAERPEDLARVMRRIEEEGAGVEGGSAVVEVADEGPGIPPEHAGRIFERFYRVDPSRSRDHGGAGLGLAIVEAVARAHGGSATHRPRPGGGACFQVRLPLGRRPGGGTSEAAPASLPASSQPGPVD